LKRLVREERRHAACAKELVGVAKRNHQECAIYT
jgi:hypothetical protein